MVKKFFMIFCFFLICVSMPIPLYAQAKTAESKIMAYYFHTTFRCHSCSQIEKYSQDAIESNFKDLIDRDIVAFKSINVDKPENKHFIKDYKLYTKSLILSRVKDGQEVESKNLTQIWQKARNKDRFYKYVIDEMNQFLQER